MIEYRTIKIKLYPNETCKKEINRLLTETAIIYNEMLEIKLAHYVKTENIQNLSYVKVVGEKTIRALGAQILLQIQYDSEDEFLDVLQEYKRHGNLKLRKLNGYGKVRIPCMGKNERLDYENSCLILPIIGCVKYQKNVFIKSSIKLGKVVLSHEVDDHYYASIMVKHEIYEFSESKDSNGSPRALAVRYSQANQYMDRAKKRSIYQYPSCKILGGIFALSIELG